MVLNARGKVRFARVTLHAQCYRHSDKSSSQVYLHGILLMSPDLAQAGGYPGLCATA